MIRFSAENGRAFEDAFAFAQNQVRKLVEKHPDFYPMYTKNGHWKHEGPAWTHWCDGFLPGMMWIFQKHARSRIPEAKYWLEQAIRYTKPLDRASTTATCTISASSFCPPITAGISSRRIRRCKRRADRGGQNAGACASRRTASICARSSRENSLFIDIMMNVGIIFYAARETGDRQLRDIAMRHSPHHAARAGARRRLDRARRHLRPGNRRVPAADHAQGYRGDSCWSRGLAWALYGFSTCYEYSRDPRFLDTAEACADYYITHTPADGVPPWDFNAPAESPGAAGYLGRRDCRGRTARLCRLVPDPMKGHLYWSTRSSSCARCARSIWPRAMQSGKAFSRAASTTSTKSWAWMSR